LIFLTKIIQKMVKKNNKVGIKMIGIDRDEFDDDDQFLKADEYLINEALNEQEGDDENNYLNDRDEVLIENLKKIDGKKRYSNKSIHLLYYSSKTIFNIN